MRVAARRVAGQRRFTSAQSEALTKGEFRHYDASGMIRRCNTDGITRTHIHTEPYKYCADVTGYSTWGLFFFALQLQFLIVWLP